MSAVEGSALVVYQGARARRSATSAGWCPAVAYHKIAMLWQARVNGMVRCTPVASRLRAGYEVFRFGATELQDREQARDLLQAFFADLFRRFGVTPAPAEPGPRPG
jgi:hypothetical protein